MILEDILTSYNQKLTFKLVSFLILSLPSFQYSSQMQNILLSLFPQNITCQYNSSMTNVQISQNQCWLKFNNSMNIKCTKWNFSLVRVGKTMVTDYKLVCDYQSYGDIILITWYMTALSAPIMGWLSDRFGRKKIVLFNLCLETVSSIFVCFTPNLESNIFLRICIGISSNGLYTSYVWLTEMVDNEFREIVGSFFWIYGCIAYMVFPLTAYLSKNWRTTQLFSLIPSIFYLLILFIPESPRWLCVNKKQDEMMISLKRIAHFNKIDFKLSSEEIYSEKAIENQNCLMTFKSGVFIFRFIICLFFIYTINLLYSAISIKLDILSTNIYISMFLLGLMELPGVFLSFVTLRYIKRKLSYFIIGGVGSSLLLLSMFFSRDHPKQAIVRIILGCLAKITITSCNQSSMIYVGELIPTTQRSFGFAGLQLANFLSIVSAIYINKLASIYFFLPMLIYFILIWSTGFLIFSTLPETKDLPIPETLLDINMLRNGEEENFKIYMRNKISWDEKIGDNEDERNNEHLHLIKR